MPGPEAISLAWAWHPPPPPESQVTTCTGSWADKGARSGEALALHRGVSSTLCSPPSSLLASLLAPRSQDDQGSTVSDKAPPQPLPLFHSVVRPALPPGVSCQSAPCPVSHTDRPRPVPHTRPLLPRTSHWPAVAAISLASLLPVLIALTDPRERDTQVKQRGSLLGNSPT